MNVHKANKHLIKEDLVADRLFIPKGNYNSTSHTYLPMHIRKLIHHRNIFESKTDQINKLILLTITSTNTWNQHLKKINHKHNPHFL